MTLPEDQKKLEVIPTPSLEAASFQFITVTAHHFTELITRYVKEKKDYMGKLKEIKKEASKYKKELATFRPAYDEKVRDVEADKAAYKEELQNHKDHIAELPKFGRAAK